MKLLSSLRIAASHAEIVAKRATLIFAGLLAGGISLIYYRDSQFASGLDSNSVAPARPKRVEPEGLGKMFREGGFRAVIGDGKTKPIDVGPTRYDRIYAYFKSHRRDETITVTLLNPDGSKSCSKETDAYQAWKFARALKAHEEEFGVVRRGKGDTQHATACEKMKARIQPKRRKSGEKISVDDLSLKWTRHWQEMPTNLVSEVGLVERLEQIAKHL